MFNNLNCTALLNIIFKGFKLRVKWEELREIDFELEFHYLQGHFIFLKNAFLKEQDRIDSKYNGIKESSLKYTESVYYISSVFTSIQWSSAFVNAFNLFEKTLNDICKTIQGLSCFSKGLKESKGMGIQRAKNYLSKDHDIRITAPFLTKEWERINNFLKIRHVLSHTYGELDLSQDSHLFVFNIAKKEKAIIIENHDTFFRSATITIEDDYVMHAIKIYREFIKILIEEIIATR